MDGLYGAAQSPHLICQLTLAEQKRSWEQVVSLSALAVSQSNLQSSLSLTNLHLGLIRALQRLGWNSLLKAQLNELKSTSIWQHEFADIESELEWRMGNWETNATNEKVETGKAIGFNAALLHALRDLKDGNRNGFLLNLRACRYDTIKELSSSATESLAAVNPALVRLQMVDMMAEGWCTKWSTADGEHSMQQISTFDLILHFFSHNSCFAFFLCASLTTQNHNDVWELSCMLLRGFCTKCVPCTYFYHPTGLKRNSSFQATASELSILSRDNSSEVVSVGQVVLDDDAIDSLERVWEEREELAGKEGRFDLMNPLLALHGVLLKCLGRSDCLPKVLLAKSRNARVIGDYPAARQALEDIRHIVSQKMNSGSKVIDRSVINDLPALMQIHNGLTPP